MSALDYDVTVKPEGDSLVRAAAFVDALIEQLQERHGVGADDASQWRSDIDATPWVPSLSAAHMTIIDFELARAALGTRPSREEGLAYFAAKRTWCAASKSDQLAYMADYLGVSVTYMTAVADQLRHGGAWVEGDSEQACALYKHFDDADNLLYVGISEKPAERNEQHRYHSPWFPLVARTDVEWFSSRDEAACLEREAIATEAPLFNKTHNKSNRDAAVLYLLAKVGGGVS